MATRRTIPAGLIFLGILVLTFAAYAPVFQAKFVWDDDSWLTDNPAISDPHGLHAIWTSVPRMQYYPLTFSSFWIEHRVFGFAPLGYHIDNVLLHAVNAFLVGLILRSLKVPGAFLVAAIFAVHPVHVESVAWVTERKNVLSGLFCLGAALAYLEFARVGRRALYAAALALFAAALLSKTATATLPVALAVVIAWRRWPQKVRELAPLAPFAALAVVLASITVSLEKGMVEAVSPEFGFGLSDRLIIACRALLFYPYKLAVPYPLIFNYPRFDIASASPLALWPLVAVALIAAGLAALWRRGERGVPSAALVYAVTIFPALGFFDVYAFRFSFVADHFQYLASIGLLALVPQAGGRLKPAAARALAVGLVVVLAALTWNQARAYRDEATLWKDTIAKNPDSWIAHHNLARLRASAGELDDAVAGFGEAIRSKPSSAESYSGRGLAYYGQQRLDLALADLDRAIELDPSYPEAYLNRGTVRSAASRFDEAIADFSRFLAFNPGYAPAYVAQAMARGLRGDNTLALEDLTQALALDPRSKDALVLRGGLYQRLDGDKRRACTDWLEACRLGDCRLFDAHCR